MNFKANEKLNQFTENTLVVGMDIAKTVHYACFVDERGRVIEKAFAVHQSRKGFEAFYQKIRQAMKETKKTEVIIGIEPTGHYWMNLAYFLDQYGVPLVMVNPLHVKRSKELDDNLPTKNDKKDALVIAVDPHCTSQKCHSCGHTAKENRQTQAAFICVSCGHSENADTNASRNIHELAMAH